jgi:hypothetical protein
MTKCVQLQGLDAALLGIGLMMPLGTCFRKAFISRFRKTPSETRRVDMPQPRSEASLRAVGLGALISVLSPVRTRFKMPSLQDSGSYFSDPGLRARMLALRPGLCHYDLSGLLLQLSCRSEKPIYLINLAKSFCKRLPL